MDSIPTNKVPQSQNGQNKPNETGFYKLHQKKKKKHAESKHLKEIFANFSKSIKTQDETPPSPTKGIRETSAVNKCQPSTCAGSKPAAKTAVVGRRPSGRVPKVKTEAKKDMEGCRRSCKKQQPQQQGQEQAVSSLAVNPSKAQEKVDLN